MSHRDDENPEWTEADFARAKGPESLPPHVLAAFPKTRGRPKKPDARQVVSLRLAPEILAHYKAKGKGWRQAVEQTLRDAMNESHARP